MADTTRRWCASCQGKVTNRGRHHRCQAEAQHKNCTCRNSIDCCTVRTVGTRLCTQNKNVHHSVDELKLGRRHEHVQLGVLELVAVEHRDDHNEEEEPSGASSSSSFSSSSSSQWTKRTGRASSDTPRSNARRSPSPSPPSPTSSSQPASAAPPPLATGGPSQGGSGPRCRRWRRRQPTTAQRGEEHQRQPRNRPWLLAPAARQPQTEAPAAPPEAGSSVPVGRSTSRSLPPLWPWWLSSGSVERRSTARCGASQQPGPQRSTAARVATTSAVVAASDAEQLPRAARWPSQMVTRHQK